MSQLHPGLPSQTTPGDASYDDKRAEFPAAELEKYIGRWVAFSADGGRIVDGCRSLGELKRRLETAGHDPHKVVFSRIPSADEVQSGSELS